MASCLGHGFEHCRVSGHGFGTNHAAPQAHRGRHHPPTNHPAIQLASCRMLVGWLVGWYLSSPHRFSESPADSLGERATHHPPTNQPTTQPTRLRATSSLVGWLAGTAQPRSLLGVKGLLISLVAGSQMPTRTWVGIAKDVGVKGLPRMGHTRQMPIDARWVTIFFYIDKLPINRPSGRYVI